MEFDECRGDFVARFGGLGVPFVARDEDGEIALGSEPGDAKPLSIAATAIITAMVHPNGIAAGCRLMSVPPNAMHIKAAATEGNRRLP